MKKLFIIPEISLVELHCEEAIMASGDPLANKNKVKYTTDDNQAADGFGSVWDAHDWI